MRGKLEDGNCSLTVDKVQLQDEGNWRCEVKIQSDKKLDETHTLRGPLIHLHILEFQHSQGKYSKKSKSTN